MGLQPKTSLSLLEQRAVDIRRLTTIDIIDCCNYRDIYQPWCIIYYVDLTAKQIFNI